MRFNSILTVTLFAAIILKIDLFSQFANITVNEPQQPGYRQPCEVAIAINPANPDIIAAGAVSDFFYISTDAGQTWTETKMTSQYNVYGDPALTFDRLGNLYYSHLSNPSSNIGYWIDRIVVQKSTDYGEVWSSESGLGYSPPRANQDKEWITADITPSSPYFNYVYCSWTEFDHYGSNDESDSTRILISYYNGRKWSSPVKVSDQGGNCLDGDNTVEGAVPAAGPHGEVYLSWAGPQGIMFDKSTDGGATWGNDVFVNDQPGGWAMSVEGVPRCNGLPVTGCDISFGAHRGNIYIGWADQRNGVSNPDVFLSRSTDGGITWSSAVRVNNDNTERPQFFPWMCVDPKTGYIYFVFYDRRNTTEKDTEVYLARSKDGGETFENFRISDTPFSFEPISVFFGDYNNIAAYDGKIYPVWTRAEQGGDQLNIMVAPIEDEDLVVSKEEGVLISEYRLFNNHPNPFNPSTNISYQVPVRTRVLIKVYDMLGREIETLVDDIKPAGFYDVRFNAGSLSSGTYLYQLQAGSFSDFGKMVLIK